MYSSLRAAVFVRPEEGRVADAGLNAEVIADADRLEQSADQLGVFRDVGTGRDGDFDARADRVVEDLVARDVLEEGMAGRQLDGADAFGPFGLAVRGPRPRAVPRDFSSSGELAERFLDLGRNFVLAVAFFLGMEIVRGGVPGRRPSRRCAAARETSSCCTCCGCRAGRTGRNACWLAFPREDHPAVQKWNDRGGGNDRAAVKRA